MNLKEIYPELKLSADILGISNNSKQIKKNYIYVAIKGRNTNGAKYVDEAILNGAILVVSNQNIKTKIPFKKVKNAKEEYIKLLQNFYHYKPDIYTIGITGTDGKTTTAALLNNILNLANTSCYIGTNGINYLNKKIPNQHTTPTPNLLYDTYHNLKKHQINDLVMEVSSEAIVDERIYNFKFNGAIFTNLSHEHLNTHKTMENYFQAKSQLFRNLDSKDLAIINQDDKYAQLLKTYTKAKIVTYGLNQGLYQAKNIQLNFNKSKFDVFYKGYYLATFNLPLFGKYNIYNALAAISYTNELGIDLKWIIKGIEEIKPIDGRFMTYSKHNITGIVDFAHTPNAIKNLLANLNEFKKGKIILILGAQGEKDYTKRSQMGLIATTYADITIFTSEDPKNESIFNIFYDLTKQITNHDYYLTLSRQEAIKLAKHIARANDIILITGKGNEQTEKIANFEFKHNDYQLLKEALDS